ncbi:asparagine synthase (glutamine-hydrolyzing) [Robertkochia marina]|uniref:asparagine synthase (glutamine-hydrolyzing) n=1 Tax=Robertkochia marina TaxID=1227945 RepID=A0A4S3LYW0_9FLAO|nr:asparagine synthase (glutamine-hydrolyzing) [Robertkochia marina]THD66772.1 asparagine synthase (glutamine-hydrolyzing) [Robertkochia marina]TRZ41937.1 asparagine synthase (glutamine-hydrolyzing) [Robertkochia marina]
MCGINGIIARNSSIEHVRNTMNTMNALIHHRGPDGGGFFIEKFRENTFMGLGMKRLAIIDLNNGVQPMLGRNGELALVFNGEIYNFQLLKEELKAQGVTFSTNSDTEVILKIYEFHGISGFRKLDGMFAFSLLDLQKHKVFLVRDFFGEKPLYYKQNSNGMIWGSELKSIISALDSKPDIDKHALNLFLRLTYIPAPKTIYEGIKKLEPNRILSYDILTNETSIQKLYKQNSYYHSSNFSFVSALKETRRLVQASVESRSISDVPIGTFLSGGIDSSIISLCLAKASAKPINTFSIANTNSDFDESKKAKTVSKIINSNHHEFIIKEDELTHSIGAILDNFDEPFADSSAIPSFLLARKTNDHVKVALTGDGGDELFGGYNKYYIGKINRKYTSLIPKSLHDILSKRSSLLLSSSSDKRGRRFRIQKLLNAIDYGDEYYWNIISLGFTPHQLNSFLSSEYKIKGIFSDFSHNQKTNNLHDYRHIDKNVSLEGDMLVKVDRTSMLNSLECRSPFLNKTLWEFTNSLPEDYLLKGFNKKYLLKKAFESEFPNGFFDKKKQGFGIPIGDWLRESLKTELMGYIDPEKLKNQNIFSIEKIQNLVLNHISGQIDNTFSVWTFYCFQRWYYHTFLK